MAEDLKSLVGNSNNTVGSWGALLGHLGGFGRAVELQFIFPDWGRTLISFDGEPLKRGRKN